MPLEARSSRSRSRPINDDTAIVPRIDPCANGAPQKSRSYGRSSNGTVGRCLTTKQPEPCPPGASDQNAISERIPSLERHPTDLSSWDWCIHSSDLNEQLVVA